jgi:hypothetical protein
LSNEVNIPEELYTMAREMAEAHNVSVKQVVINALLEHLAAWQKLRGRGSRGDREKFLAVLDRVPDVEPDPFDAL